MTFQVKITFLWGWGGVIIWGGFRSSRPCSFDETMTQINTRRAPFNLDLSYIDALTHRCL